MEDTLELKRGILHLQPVSGQGIRHLLIKTGLMKLLDDPELLENQEKRQAWIEKMGEKQQARLAEGEYQLFNYCAGWGVKDNPPEEAMDELAALGFAERGMPHLTRANWLRFLFLDGDDEAGTLVGAVMSLTAKGDEEPEEIEDGNS